MLLVKSVAASEFCVVSLVTDMCARNYRLRMRSLNLDISTHHVRGRHSACSCLHRTSFVLSYYNMASLRRTTLHLKFHHQSVLSHSQFLLHPCYLRTMVSGESPCYERYVSNTNAPPHTLRRSIICDAGTRTKVCLGHDVLVTQITFKGTPSGSRSTVELEYQAFDGEAKSCQIASLIPGQVRIPSRARHCISDVLFARLRMSAFSCP